MRFEELFTRAIDRALPIVGTSKSMIRLLFLRNHGRLPNLRHPRTFSEKIQHHKLFHRDSRLTALADKVLVKDHVARVLGPEWLNPTIWSGPVLPPRTQRSWPIPYVIKANHGCAWLHFVRSPEDQDWDRIEKLTSRWMSRSYGVSEGEWQYGEIRRQILVEPCLDGPAGLPWDYKFWVFGGRAHYIEIDTGRGVNHRRVFYDRNWVRQPFTYKTPMDPRSFEPPSSFEAMLRAAERLAEPFPFVRVDFYEVDGRPLFGEMTFTPTSGWGVFTPDSWDAEFGRLMPDPALRLPGQFAGSTAANASAGFPEGQGMPKLPT